MTTALDRALRGVTKNVLGVLGTSVRVRVVTAGSYDTTTGTATDTTADTTCNGTLRSIRVEEVFGLAEITDQVLMVAASALTAAPKPRDRVVIGSDVYDIIAVHPIQVQDVPAAYDLVIRGPLS